MAYFYQVAIDIFCILSLSLFLNHVFNIKLNHCFLISLCSSATAFYFAYLLIPLSFLKFFIYFYLLIVFLIPWKIILDNKIAKKSKDLLLEFFIIAFIISFFCWNRYYLDEDELNYWGKIIKYFHIIKNASPDDYPLVYLYHKPFLPLLHFVNSFFTSFREDISIFSNNLFIISAFYFVFYHEKINLLKRIFLLAILYLCTNNLSFGFVSIYADPIIGMLYLSAIFYIYESKENLIRNNDFFIIAVLGISLFLLHRSGVIYLLFLCLFWIFFNYRVIEKKKLFIVPAIFCLVFIYIFNYRISIYALINNLSISPLVSFCKNFLFVDIYFSDFGVSFNTILQFMGINNFKLLIFDISVLFWLTFILLLTVLNFNRNLKIIFFIVSQFLLYSFMIYFFKIKIDGLSILVYGRYIGIFFLSILLFNIYFISLKKPTYILFIVFFAMILITPRKTFGFFLPESLYLKDQSNFQYKKNRNEIKKLSKLLNPQKKIIVIQGGVVLNNTLHHPSLPLSVMSLEFYGINLIANKKFSNAVVDYDFYWNNDLSYENYNKVFYNLSTLEINNIKKYSKLDKDKSFFINLD